MVKRKMKNGKTIKRRLMPLVPITERHGLKREEAEVRILSLSCGTSTPLSLREDLKPTTGWSHLTEPGIVCLATARMYLLSKSYLLNSMLRPGGLIYRMQSAWTWRQIQVESRDQRTPDRG